MAALHERGLIEADTLLRLFAAIEPALVRYPAIDPAVFRRQVERAAASTRAARHRAREPAPHRAV